MAGLTAEASAFATAHQAAVGEVVHGVHEALNNEAMALRNEQLMHEQRSAEICEQLLSLVSAFAANPLPMDNRGQSVLGYRNRIEPWINALRLRAEARSMAPRPDLAARYIQFAARLSSDPMATLA